MMNTMNATNRTTTVGRPEFVLWYWSLRAAISILTVLGNAFVVFLIVRFPRLRVSPNAFIFALALADFAVGAVITPSDFACTYWYPNTCDGNRLRLVYDILFHLSVTNLCALALDRYTAVVSPLKYASIMTRGRPAIIIAVACGAAALLPTVGYISGESRQDVDRVFRAVDTVFLQVLPPILLAIAYGRMVYIARIHERKIKLQEAQIYYNYGDIMNLQQPRRIRQGESRERASVKMIGAVIIAFILCYGLAMFRSLYFYIMGKHIPEAVTHISRLLLLSNSAVNFLAYAFLKKDFKRELRRMCK